MRWLVAVMVLARSVAADPTVGARVRTQVYFSATDVFIVGARVAVAHTWDERWQLGAQAGAAFGEQAHHLFADVLAEGLVWLHPSTRLDVAMGWRAGYSYIHLDYGAHVHALIIEPVLAFRFPLGERTELVVEPFAVTLYHSGPWEAAFGAAAGIGWAL